MVPILQSGIRKAEGSAARRLIEVGAATEIEMKEKKARVEDALHATRATSSSWMRRVGSWWRRCATTPSARG
jgi:hypothetical protein